MGSYDGRVKCAACKGTGLARGVFPIKFAETKLDTEAKIQAEECGVCLGRCWLTERQAKLLAAGAPVRKGYKTARKPRKGRGRPAGEGGLW